MSELIVRPSMRFIRFGYWTAIFIFLIAVFIYVNYLIHSVPGWLLILPALLILWPMRYHLQQRFTAITIAGDKLRYESGMFSKCMRTIQLSKVQDVRVDQSAIQRIFRLGDLSVETAGETSQLTIRNVDEPQEIADQIVEATHQTESKPQKGKK